MALVLNNAPNFVRGSWFVFVVLVGCGDVLTFSERDAGPHAQGLADASLPTDAGSTREPPDAARPLQDAGTPDAGRPDSGLPPVVILDAGNVDSTPDAGQTDSGTRDAGVIRDAGMADAGLNMTPRLGVRHSWVSIPAGTFVMGSAPTRPCREKWGDKETQHQVTLTRAFEISTHEVTETQFQQVKGFGNTGCPQCPVTQVTWADATDYCNALSANESGASLTTCYQNGTVKPQYAGQNIYRCPGYRLPTEAEFEYAYRAGTTTDFYNGDATQTNCNDGDPAAATPSDPLANEIAINAGNSSDRRAPVGQKRPNQWGLYDMAGNAWNFCHDWWVADLGSGPVTDPWGVAGPTEGHSVRGGSYHYNFSRQRAAQRSRLAISSPATGLRCVRTLTP